MPPTATSDLDRTLYNANAALHTRTERQTSRGEKLLEAADDVYDSVSGLSSNGYVTATSDVVSAGMALLGPELDNFKTNCDILMKTLDAVAKVHPFVTVAVLAFKTAVTFEMTRRQNDKRIVALHVSMLDLMAVIGLLRNLAKDDHGSDGVSIADRLHDRMQAIAKDIETCAATCDSFQKKKLIVKVFKSIAWEGKLEGFATAFDGHKDALHKDLSMHTALGVERANQTLSAVDVAVKTSGTKLDMILLFQQLRSPDERELWKFIESKGGPDKFLADDTLMNELLARTEKGTADQLTSVNEVKYDIRKDLAEIIKENLEVSENKFQALQITIRGQMEQTVRREGDRIIGTLLSGPQDRIIDPNVWEIWHEMGWKGSAKARHLVMALREFYAERYADAADEGVITVAAPRKAANTPVSPIWGSTSTYQQRRKAVGVRPEDRWTLDYITILRIQPLLEAFDDDASSFVTVSEVNAFTQARPRDWSLPHWMAYWTIGYPLSMRYYHDRIQQVVSKIAELADQMLPVNRAIYDKFQGSGILGNFELVLAAAYKAEDHIAWDPQLFDRFKSYVSQEEKRMKETLETVKYRIDAPSTLTLLLGSGRLEKHLLPLMYLMYHRYLELLTIGRSVALHRDEVLEMLNSSQMIEKSMRARLENVKAMCTIQNQNISDHLKKFAFGLYYYLEFPNDWTESAYYKFYYSHESEDEERPAVEDEPIETDPDKVLLRGRQDDGVDLSEYERPFEPRPVLEPAPNSSELWHTCWRGCYKSDALSWLPMFSGHLDIEIPPTDGTFSGRGVDAFATFSIFGKRVGWQVAFTKTHDGESEGSQKQYTWEGTLNDAEDEIIGTYCYGHPVEADTVLPVITAGSGMGTFKLNRRPLYYYLYRPPDAAFDYNKARSLWRYALNSVQHAVRAQGRLLSWDFVKERRDRRAKYVERYMQLDELNGSWKELTVRDWIDEAQAKEMVKIEMTATVADHFFYRSLARCIMLREVIHAGAYCFVCRRPEGFPATRVTCLECTSTSFGVEGNTVDFCAEHMLCDYEHDDAEDDDNIHTNDHRLIQVRKSAPQRLMHKLVAKGKEQMELMDSFPTHTDENDSCVTHPRCIRCKEIPSQPYWYCLECNGEIGETYMCQDCNKKDEAERLSRFASREDYRPTAANATPGHKWTHSMILWQHASEDEDSPSVEDRLSTLEENFRNLESSINSRQDEFSERLQRLEDLMGKLVSMLSKKPARR
ncbi:hypothetical protein PsYK624_012790 [Phanerochaete sordida]|uniref:Vacuolar protein sorting-associated protein 13 second N-terminal domain-containing protein n=1 Tax=Phanerochaete sordida TaxID=48140 RepID=A0A9P3FZ27_9APHY|nr:hypothetical protein PsYK624_012790 [Phanerochaete sordida]